VVHTNVLQGESTTVAVLLDAQGDENAVGFTISFDPVAIEFAGVALGDNAATGTLQSNPAQAGAGRIGIALALPTGTTFSPGPKEILRFTFSASSASASSFPITITDQIVTRCVSDVLAWELPVSFVNGTLTIDPILTSPLIAISPSGTDVVLTWPLAAANFTLQSLDSTNGLSGNWSNTPVTLQTNGNTVVATLPATNESRFFRLIYP